MEEEKHLNVKKVIITVAIFIFAFIVILGSALLTNKLGNFAGKTVGSSKVSS